VFLSLLPVVTVVALGLLVPASVTALLLARGRHASASSGGDRRGRVAVATALVAVAGGAVGVAVGAGPAAVAAASLLLAAPVLAWAVLAPWWPVRAVVAWAMLVTGSVGLVAMATGRALESSLPWTALPVAGVGSAVVVLVLGRVNGPFRRVLGIRAGLHRAVRAPLFLRPAMLRPALTLAVFLAAMAVGGLTGVAPRPGEGNAPEAGPGTPSGASDGPGAVDGSDVRPVSAEATTPAEAARGEGSAWPSHAGPAERAGSDRPGAGASARHDQATARTDDGRDTRRSTPGSGSSTGTTDHASDQSSTPAGDPVSAAPQKDPVTEVRDTTKPATEPVQTVVEDTTKQVTDPLQDTVEKTTEPVQTVVEDTTEQVTDPVSSVLP